MSPLLTPVKVSFLSCDAEFLSPRLIVGFARGNQSNASISSTTTFGGS